MTTDNAADAKRNAFYFNNQVYNLFVTFDNLSTPAYNIPNDLILEMVLEENLLNWPYRGYIVYNNMYEGIERNLENEFFYRMDCRDEIHLEFSAIPDTEKTPQPPKELWNINLDFVVYDTEDLPSDNNMNKRKKLYFWDKNYQFLMDRKLNWSTAGNVEGASHLSENERSMFTGDIIKNLLIDGGYESFIDNENWDVGATKQFYTSPANNSITDDISTILDSHLTADKDDFAVLKYNNKYESKFQLIPMYKFFENAGGKALKRGEDGKIEGGTGPGEWQLEHYFFQEDVSDNENTTPFRSPVLDDVEPTDPDYFKKDIKPVLWNTIISYRFSDMSGIDNTKALVSKPVYSYCFVTGDFRMDYKDHEIETVKEEFKKLYTDNLFPAERAVPIFTLNTTKTDQINTESEFTFSRSAYSDNPQNRLIHGRGKILFAGVFLNEFIHFRVPGSPHRTIGKFIAIDRLSSYSTLKFDNKICGQWLVTNVKHIWDNDRYVNDICAVKVHMYEDSGILENVV